MKALGYDDLIFHPQIYFCVQLILMPFFSAIFGCNGQAVVSEPTLLIFNLPTFCNPPPVSLECAIGLDLLNQSDGGIQALRQAKVLGEHNVLKTWSADQSDRFYDQVREITGR